MKPSSHLISSLLSDEKIRTLLNSQDHSYWESAIGITRHNMDCDSESFTESYVDFSN